MLVKPPPVNVNLRPRLVLFTFSSILGPYAVGVLSSPASVHLSVCPFVWPSLSERKFKTYFSNLSETWLDYFVGNYLGQVRWWVSQLIRYTYNWPKVIDIFCILEIIFKVRALKFDTVGPFTRLLKIVTGFTEFYYLYFRRLKDAFFVGL